MFIPFYFALRQSDLTPSMGQWMTLMEALEKNLAASSLIGFYNLCRHILLTSETEYDVFDELFIDFFQDTQKENTSDTKIPDQMMDWLIPDSVKIDDDIFFSEEHMEILRKLEEAILRILKSAEEAARTGAKIGNCEFCNGCGLCMRYKNKNSITEDPDANWNREETKKRFKNAIELAEERNYRDFREDTLIDTRQFQLAFRKLRQYSANIDVPETELDLNRTIDNTATNAGMLRIAYQRPRKNTLKLLVLFDSDGSMWKYAEICNRLFKAANEANHFKDLQFYYFHNCIYDHLYTSPKCINGQWVDTEQILRDCGTDYRVIYIGDASMADSELYKVGGNVLLERSNKSPGIAWLKRLKKHYPKSVWLNPIRTTEWNRLYGGRTIQEIKSIFPMFELTVKGLENAVKKLMISR